MDAKALAEQRLDRLMKAVRHEKPDRTPLSLNGSIAFMKYAGSQKTVADFCNDPVAAAREAYPIIAERLPNIDMADGFGMYPPTMGLAWWCDILIPGRELGVNDLWQLDEKYFMTRDDYDVILDKGWDWYTNDVIFNRLGITPELLEKAGQIGMEVGQITADYGYPNWGAGTMNQSVIDKLTSGRGTVGFFRDIREIPDKLKAVIEVMLETELGHMKEGLKNAKPGTVGMCAPAIRCTCDYVSEAVFEEFIWPTMYKPADLMLEAGLYVFFHNDSNWNDFLHFYTHFPKKRCIYDSDGQTDIYKIKELLGDSMCITGNVSPSMLSLGTPDEVYAFCRQQIEDMGDAYILSGSCSLPPNTKPENLDAMNAAVAG
ncbi:MAG: hypothetical protein LBG68_00580 [Coriobacteriales bacterium]|jgi:uroporphyrinogen decarboxylase|nr:hypothetical protein [Coriobacteriales bacterium]